MMVLALVFCSCPLLLVEQMSIVGLRQVEACTRTLSLGLHCWFALLGSIPKWEMEDLKGNLFV